MPESKKHKPNTGEIPKSIINQVNEHTEGGFVLFYFNSKDGAPEEYMTFDSPAHALALQKHIADWTYALQDLHVETEKHHIQMACRREIEEEDDDSSDGAPK